MVRSYDRVAGDDRRAALKFVYNMTRPRRTP